VQGRLRDLGTALGFDVWIAANDVSRSYNAGRLGDGCLRALPAQVEQSPGVDVVRLIDVI
jgi:type II restriction enzyme